MLDWRKILTITCLLILLPTISCSEPCSKKPGLHLQFLGTGGPIADDSRASTSYLIWLDGKSRILIDFGGGAFLRFSQAYGNIEDLDFIGITHFHVGHTADLIALLKSAFFSKRKRPLPISGPASNQYFPDTKQYLNALLNKQSGAYPYLSGFLDGSNGLFLLQPIVINTDKPHDETIYNVHPIQIHSFPVPHGQVPSLAYKITLNNKTIVFASDQSLSSETFIEFAKNADILLAHLAISENAGELEQQLHAKPSQIGKFANQANVKTLILSHFMQRSIAKLNSNLAKIRAAYQGDLVLAEDLQCYRVE